MRGAAISLSLATVSAASDAACAVDFVQHAPIAKHCATYVKRLMSVGQQYDQSLTNGWRPIEAAGVREGCQGQRDQK
jgi:hypothetical protein